MEDLNETLLSGESGFVDLGCVIGAKDGMGGLANDAVAWFYGKLLEIELRRTCRRLEGNQDVGDDSVSL